MGKTPKRASKGPDIGKRLREARERAGISQEGLGRHVGVTRAAVSQWEDSGEVKVLNLALAASVLRVDLNWMITGDGDSNIRTNGGSPPNAKGVLIEMRDGLGTAGPAHLHTMAEWWRVNPSVLKSMGVAVNSVKIYRVDTDLMAPTINPGAYVLIDFAQTKVRHGQVYAIDNGISLTLRRVAVADRRTVQLRCDNDRVPPTTLLLKNVKPVGRLVAQMLSLL